MTTATVTINAEDLDLLTIPDELSNSKVYEQFAKTFGEDEARTFFRKSESSIRGIIAECSIQKEEITKARDENEAFAKAKLVVSDFNKASRDSCKEINLKAKAGSVAIAYRNEVKRAK